MIEEYFRQRFIDELNDEGDIVIRTRVWKRSEILELAGQQIFNALLVDWVASQRLDACDQTEEFLQENGCMDRFETLVRRCRDGAVIPFVGAGMSCASGHKLWGEFLVSLLAEAPNSIPEAEALLQNFLYEDAAQLVHDVIGADNLSHEIREKLGLHKTRVDGPVQILPSIFDKLVVTTNFDYVLNYAYKCADLPFSESICGVYLRDSPIRIAQDPHCLLRLHGEAEVSYGRVLTTTEYDEAYRDSSVLAEVMASFTGTASFLFLGCSLENDRTIKALRALKERSSVNRPPHYAFLPEPKPQDRAERSEFLGQAGIRPIYYPTGNHDSMLESLLIALKEGVA